MNALGADLIPDPTTAGDFCRRFGEDDVVELMERINLVRPQLWTGRGRDLLGPITYIDADLLVAPCRPAWATRAQRSNAPICYANGGRSPRQRPCSVKPQTQATRGRRPTWVALRTRRPGS